MLQLVSCLQNGRGGFDRRGNAGRGIDAVECSGRPGFGMCGCISSRPASSSVSAAAAASCTIVIPYRLSVGGIGLGSLGIAAVDLVRHRVQFA